MPIPLDRDSIIRLFQLRHAGYTTEEAAQEVGISGSRAGQILCNHRPPKTISKEEVEELIQLYPPTAKRGRPSKLTQEDYDTIRMNKANGWSAAEIADAMGKVTTSRVSQIMHGYHIPSWVK